MYLKRIELLGFKSFASKTVLELERGITGIVGPNGSGKSNVADAVRWALGEQSLRVVRSRKGEDVIFSGNSHRASVGMAEVTLVFDNSQGIFPLPFGEVSIARRQYRSGEGEYLINKARARLRDVVELLTHARLGPDSYAMVGQGAVDEVLQQRPEERRALVEAAADISRYQMKLKESLDRLVETEANIQRVEDIRHENAPQLSRLRQQANRAQRYEQVVRRLKEMVQWRYLLQIREARERALSALRGEESRAEASAARSRELESSRHRVAELRDRLRQEEAALDAAREHLGGLRLARATAEREAALLQERESAYGRQLNEAEEELAGARREREELRVETEKLAAARGELVAKASGIRAEMVPVEREWQRASSEERLLQAQLERVSGERQGLASRASELQERRNVAVRDSQRAEQVRRESAEAAEAAATRLAALEEQTAQAQGEMDRLRSELADVDARRKDVQSRLGSLGGELEAARRAERDAWERDRELQHRLAILRSLKEEHRGVSAGAKAILGASLAGVHGTLASLIRVPEEYLIAVTAALAEAQGYVVSDGLQEGLRALQFVADHRAAAAIAPLQLDGAGDPRELVAEFSSGLDGLLEGIGFRGLAADLVSCPDDARGLCARYLGLTLVVESLRDALVLYGRLLRRTSGRVPFQVVTLDGRVLRARGDLVSMQSDGKDGSLLARENELLSLSSLAERARSRLQESKDAVATLEATHSDLTRQASESAAAASRLQAEIGKWSATHAELASQVGKLEAAIEWHRSRAAGAEREAAQSQKGLARTEQELASLVTRRAEVESRVEQLREDLAAQQSCVAELAARLSRLRSELAAAESRLRELDARVSAVSEGLQRADARVARQEERVAQLSEALDQLRREPRVVLPASLLQGIEDAEKSVNEASALVARTRDALSSAEAEFAALSESQESAREELANARTRAQRASMELAVLVREAAREAGMEAEEAEPDTPAAMVEYACGVAERLRDVLVRVPAESLPETLEAASKRVETLRREVASLGTINADAPEEYRLLSERHSFLTAQLDDLRRAERTLRKAIEELKEIMEARFQESFDRVNAEFGQCFSTLFGGGSARLALTQPDQPLGGGVEIVATPPGKRSGSLLGLSGGERALTAIALLFALMRVNPSPFCMLDEVDAALDESNVQRFCNLLRELTDSTQFLVITHNRATMEMASALHGVSMNPDSTSRVVSLRLASKESEA